MLLICIGRPPAAAARHTAPPAGASHTALPYHLFRPTAPVLPPGMSVMEMSHRGKEFQSIIDAAEADLRALLSIPDNYHVLFMQASGAGPGSGNVWDA